MASVAGGEQSRRPAHQVGGSAHQLGAAASARRHHRAAVEQPRVPQDPAAAAAARPVSSAAAKQPRSCCSGRSCTCAKCTDPATVQFAYLYVTPSLNGFRPADSPATKVFDYGHARSGKYDEQKVGFSVLTIVPSLNPTLRCSKWHASIIAKLLCTCN